MQEDARSDGNFWRSQPWVAMRSPAPDLVVGGGRGHEPAMPAPGVPAIHVNADPEAGGNPAGGIGGSTGRRIETRASILALREAMRAAIEAAGAEVVLTDFPAVTNDEGDRPGPLVVALFAEGGGAFAEAEG